MHDNQATANEEQVYPNRLGDSFFKFVFVQDDSRLLLLALINAIIHEAQPEAPPIVMGPTNLTYQAPTFTGLELENIEKVSRRKKGKIYFLDVLARMNDGTLVNIEVQNKISFHMFNRFLLYSHRISSEVASSGKDYKSVPKVISIVISNGKPIQDLGDTNYAHMLYINKAVNHRLFTDEILYYIIELQKYDPSTHDTNSNLAIFIKYLTGGRFTDDEWDSMIAVIPELSIAREREAVYMKKFKVFTDKERELDAVKVYNTQLLMSKEEGMEECKLMMINNMLNNGFDNQTISKIAGMTEAFIQQLRQQQEHSRTLGSEA